MILLRGGSAKGKALFDCPAEAWDFKMEKVLDGASARMVEKTTDVLGFKTLCDPRQIIVTWTH